MIQKKLKNEITKPQAAFNTLEHVFITLKNSKTSESNKHPLGHPGRTEYDLSEIEKAHLDLLRAGLDLEIAEAATRSSELLGRKIYFLNWAVAILTAIMAISALLELRQ